VAVCLDTSIVTPLFLTDPFNARAHSFLTSGPVDMVVSDFVAAEFASVVGVRVRAKALTRAEGRKAFSNFDRWLSAKAVEASIQPSDVRVAMAVLRRLDLVLRAPDALILAVTDRLNASLATFDARMAESARKLGISVVPV
jgi:predicted nucleic acid-binding protein